MNKKSISKNFLFNFILVMSGFIFPLISFPYVSRILSADGLGRISFATSVVNYFLTFTMLGLPLYGMKVCSGHITDRQKLVQTLKELFLINLLTGSAMLAILLLLVFAVPRFRADWQLLLIMSGLIPLNIIGIEWFYKALEKYSYITVRTLVFKLLGLLLLFPFVKTRDDLAGYAVIIVLAGSGSYILNFLKAREYFQGKGTGSLQLIKHIKPLVSLSFLTVSWTVFGNSAVILMGFLTSDAEIGYYTTAIKVRSIALSLVSSLITVILPRVMQYFSLGKEEEARLLLKKCASFLMLASLYCIGYILVNAQELVLFISGPAFIQAGPTLKVTIISTTFIGLSMMLGTNVLVAKGRERDTIYATLLGILVSISINIFLLPRFASLGAALATVLGEAAVVIFEVYVLRDEVREYFDFKNIGRIFWAFLVSTGGACLVRYLLKLESAAVYVLLSGSLYSLIYAICLLLLKEKLVEEWKEKILRKLR